MRVKSKNKTEDENDNRKDANSHPHPHFSHPHPQATHPHPPSPSPLLMSRLQRNDVRFRRRFVDDTFVIIDNNTNVNKILDILNSFDNNIVFTYEEEKNNSLSFLDIQITRLNINNITNNSKLFATTVHRKSTYAGLITKWHSFVPHSYKISTISNMVYRAIKICSTYKLMHDEFTFIENICIENGYPKNFIKSQIRKTLGRYVDQVNGTKHYTSKKETKNLTDNSTKKEQIFIDIPFVGKPTEIV